MWRRLLRDEMYVRIVEFIINLITDSIIFLFVFISEYFTELVHKFVHNLYITCSLLFYCK